MNYRHLYHAGNFADLLKHVVLTELMARLTAAAGPLSVIDTHAGAGVYDLSSDAARRTGEGAAGIGVLMADEGAPAAFDALKAAVRELNDGALRYYPGSPVLIAQALHGRDRLIACETRREDFEMLRQALRAPGASAVREDGWDVAARRPPTAPARALVLIDPPYEAGDDSDRVAKATKAVLARNADAVVAIWAPLKDLAGFDALLGAIEDAASPHPLLIAETRLRAPDDPLRLNGCAMAVVNPPAGLEAPAGAAAAWIGTRLGEPGGLGRAGVIGSGIVGSGQSRSS
ncbi:MAG TPA: 23S rRNA (adenine(2030)-N(6))-methyltransferase RlmJ [Caulobacteraceae bacterium]